MNEFPVSHWLILWIASLLGVLAVIPFQFALNAGQLQNPRLAQIPRSRLILLSLIQSGILFGVAAAVGLLAAQAVGLRTPILDSLLGAGSGTIEASTLVLAVVLGISAGLVIVALDMGIFARHLPAALKALSFHKLAAWKRFLAGFYGGIAEEVLLRLFVMSGALWLLRQIGVDSNVGAWIAILFAALLFGVGHLPATAMLTPLTPLIVVRAIVLNSVGGVVFGWLFWRYGLEWAMIAHFTADMVIQFGAPLANRFAGGQSHAQPAQQSA
ncbi:MAG: CPBP family intramembrane metalloprotease [Anaerolineae bacterium]|nr:CPBP family intramembrane metalloprotease [Anaerolineae bacterium]